VAAVQGVIVDEFQEIESGKENDRPQIAAAIAASRPPTLTRSGRPLPSEHVTMGRLLGAVAVGRMVAAARTAGGPGEPSWLRYCNVTFSPGRISQRADRMAARLAARYRAACTVAEHRISRWVDRMAAAGLTEPRCASERGLAMGGGRPAERRFTVGGSGKSVARCHRTVLAYWKFGVIAIAGAARVSE
jgi:hypothetical protein